MKAVVETERLWLREIVPDDLDFLATMHADPEVMRYYPKPLDRRGAQAWLERQRERYRRHGHGLWLVVERERECPVGQVGLNLQEVEGSRLPEVGYLLHRPYWGVGYATEAASAVRDAGFDRWRHESVISLVRPENERSGRVARRLGMRIERQVSFGGYVHDVHSVANPTASR